MSTENKKDSPSINKRKLLISILLLTTKKQYLCLQSLKKKETAWIEVGLEGKVGRNGRRLWVQGLAQTPHLPLWGLGFPSHPDPRTVL